MHMVNLKGWRTADINAMLSLALSMKTNPTEYSQILEGKKLYMLFEKTSTRTALSFGLGMNELGGIYFTQNWPDSNFAVAEIQDEVRYVGRNVDIIMARLKTNEQIEAMAQHSTVPVINGCCNMFHPCQAMADLLTIKEVFGGFDVKLLYVGIRNNVFNSLACSLPRLGGTLTVVCPITNEASCDPEVIEMATKTGHYHDLTATCSGGAELRDLVKESDVVYTDTWVDMEFFGDKSFEKEGQARAKRMMPFQLTTEQLQGSRAVVMHDMPIHPGYEITRGLVEQHVDTILRQAENRRHAQKAILATLLGAAR